MGFWISTDLDGTLLDHHDYSFASANEALKLCQDLRVPIILNTSKTFAETQHIQTALGICGPVIVENGSALIFKDSVNSATKLSGKCAKPLDSLHHQVIFGVERESILRFLQEVRQTHNWSFEGFSDWSPAEISRNTGLDLEESIRASAKKFSEPFVWTDSAENLSSFEVLAAKRGLSLVRGGRFYHLQGRCSKATPLEWLKNNLSLLPELCNQDENTMMLIALGDNHNDVAMLNAADIPVCVKTPDGKHASIQYSSNAIYTTGIGPSGWNEAIQSILKQQLGNQNG